jgi:hypothetical protein
VIFEAGGVAPTPGTLDTIWSAATLFPTHHKALPEWRSTLSQSCLYYDEFRRFVGFATKRSAVNPIRSRLCDWHHICLTQCEEFSTGRLHEIQQRHRRTPE